MAYNNWLDDYTVSYTPGGRALAAARQAVAQDGAKPARLLAISNPTGDARLTYTPAEVEAVAAMFPAGQVQILAGAEARRDDILNAATGELTHFHFSGHGQYDWDDPQNSGLVCADRRLTLHTIQRRLDLNQTRLVSLSACETGMVDLRQSPDEFIGLPAGFMAAGAPAVLSTLWAVGDLASMLLVERFYEGLLQQQLSPPEALRQAQRWLRDVTAAELADRFSAERLATLGLKLPPAIISEGYRRFVDHDGPPRPFREPYYWAGFVFNGA